VTDRERRAAERAALAGDAEGLARLRRLVTRTGELEAFDDAVDALCRRLRRAPSSVAAGIAAARTAATGWFVDTQRRESRRSEVFAVRVGTDVIELWGSTLLDQHALPADDDPEALVAEALRLDPEATRVRTSHAVAIAWQAEDHVLENDSRSHPRMRPAMYFGDTRSSGVNNLIAETLDHSIREHIGGSASRIEVTLESDGSVTVSDDGRGLLLTRSAGPMGRDASGMFRDLAEIDPQGDALMLAAACATCEVFEVTLRRNGRARRQSFRRGRASGPVEELPATTNGTCIRLRVDPLVFGDARPDAEALSGRLALLAHLLPGLHTTFREPEANAVETVVPDGLAALVRATRTRGLLDPVATATVRGEIDIDVALTFGGRGRGRRGRLWSGWTWPDAGDRVGPGAVFAFVNRHAVRTVGPIEDGLRAGLQAAVPCGVGAAASAAARELLAGVVALGLDDPGWNSVRSEIRSDERVVLAVRDAVVAALACAPQEQLALVWSRARTRGRRSR
jgi:hypothetical protein